MERKLNIYTKSNSGDFLTTLLKGTAARYFFEAFFHQTFPHEPIRHFLKPFGIIKGTPGESRIPSVQDTGDSQLACDTRES